MTRPREESVHVAIFAVDRDRELGAESHRVMRYASLGYRYLISRPISISRSIMIRNSNVNAVHVELGKHTGAPSVQRNRSSSSQTLALYFFLRYEELDSSIFGHVLFVRKESGVLENHRF